MDNLTLSTIRSRVDPLKWDQARYHIKFKHLRSGIIQGSNNDIEIAQLQRTDRAQPWRDPPPRNQLPRVTLGPGVRPERFNLHNPPLVSYAGRNQTVNLPADQRQMATVAMNQTTRTLSDLVHDYVFIHIVLHLPQITLSARSQTSGLSW